MPDKSYPEEPGYVEGSDTSRAAAAQCKAPALRDLVLSALADHPDGLTYDEIRVLIGRGESTASSRVTELMILGKIFDTGKRRNTRYRRKARVVALRKPGDPYTPPKTTCYCKAVARLNFEEQDLEYFGA